MENVQSTKSYEKHSALDNVMSIEEYKIREAYVFTNDNIKVSSKLTYLPVYMIMFLKETLTNSPSASAGQFAL